MNTIGEVLLKAREQGVPQETLRFRPARSPSPYMEVVNNELNANRIDGNDVEVNAYARYGQVFEKLLDGSVSADHQEMNDVLFDIMMHMEARNDLRTGLSRFEYRRLLLRDDFSAGVFGKRHMQSLDLFSRNDAKLVESAVVLLYMGSQPLTLFRALMKMLFCHSMIYLDQRRQTELLVYIGVRRTERLEKQVDFLVDSFTPFDYKVRLFWNRHFGIIGTEETMEMGEFVIY